MVLRSLPARLMNAALFAAALVLEPGTALAQRAKSP